MHPAALPNTGRTHRRGLKACGSPRAAALPEQDGGRRRMPAVLATLILTCTMVMTGWPVAAAQDSVGVERALRESFAGEQGKISYYAGELAGRLTASGELFDPEAMTMAHPSLPFGTLVRVTTLHAGHSVVLKVNDRGPFHGKRVADVSLAAARLLGMIRKGLVRARLEVLAPLSPVAGSRQAPSHPDR